MSAIRNTRIQSLVLISLICGLIGAGLMWWSSGFPPLTSLNAIPLAICGGAGILLPIGLSFFNLFWRATLFQNLPMLGALLFGLCFDLVFLAVLALGLAWSLGWIADTAQVIQLASQLPCVISIASIVIILFLHHFIQMIRLILGPQQLSRLLMGTRKYPHVLQRFVLTIELIPPPASTIDHHAPRYLSFLNDFFQDLENVAAANGAEIVEFTRDGAILTWPEVQGSANSQPVQTVYDLGQLMKEHATWYLVVYQTAPQFRCALHFGPVISAEMGWRQRSIVTQGAAIDFCRKLTQAAGKMNEKFLMSNDAMERLVLPAASRIHRTINAQSAGAEPTAIYSLEQLRRN